MTAPAAAELRVAPGIVQVGRDPIVLGVRPLDGVAGVWEALVDDRDGEPPRVILSMGPKVIRFIERCCVTTQARWSGKPFQLLEWQKSLLVELFEVVWDDDRGRYARRYHEALIGTPKKNGKSDWLAAVGLYFLVADGERSPVVVAAAANEVSAKLVFTPAKTMVELSFGALDRDLLSDVCDAWDSQIFLRGEPNAEMRKVPASPKATEGLNIFVNLMDEWHEWTHPAAMQTATKLMNGTALRPDYMNLRTTTAGHDLESLCGEDYTFGQAVAAREVAAPEWFFRWYEAPREVERDGRVEPLDWRSEEAVALSNPSYGQLAQWPFYANKLRRETEAIYRRYFLNQFTETEEAWLPTGAWEGCEAAELEPAPGWPTAIGWDAATKHDSTAVVLAQRQELRDEESDTSVTRIVLRSWIWERPLDPETRKPIEGWLLPIEEVKAVLAALLALYSPTSIEYDPTFITWEAAALQAIGWPMREFSQSSVQKLAQASQGFYERVIEGLVAHDGDARYTRHIRSAAARQITSGSAAWLLVKGKAKRKMDAAVATAMAIWGLEHPEAEKKRAKAPNLWVGDDDEDDS